MYFLGWLTYFLFHVQVVITVCWAASHCHWPYCSYTRSNMSPKLSARASCCCDILILWFLAVREWFIINLCFVSVIYESQICIGWFDLPFVLADIVDTLFIRWLWLKVQTGPVFKLGLQLPNSTCKWWSTVTDVIVHLIAFSYCLGLSGLVWCK